MSDIEKIINDAWEIKDQINKDSDKSITDAVKRILQELDQGKIRVAEKIDGELIEMGSAGAKAIAVVRGIADVYIHSGGQYEWDNCAPAAVAFAAGLHVSRLDGSLLKYNNPDPWLPDLLICNPVLATPVLEVLNS